MSNCRVLYTPLDLYHLTSRIRIDIFCLVGPGQPERDDGRHQRPPGTIHGGHRTSLRRETSHRNCSSTGIVVN